MSSPSNLPHRSLYSSLQPDEVISYCESRLRAAFNALERADDHKAEWIYDNMIRELVGIISSMQMFGNNELFLAIFLYMDRSLCCQWAAARYPGNYTISCSAPPGQSCEIPPSRLCISPVYGCRQSSKSSDRYH